VAIKHQPSIPVVDDSEKYLGNSKKIAWEGTKQHMVGIEKDISLVAIF
jgi:hypothetical protein